MDLLIPMDIHYFSAYWKFYFHMNSPSFGRLGLLGGWSVIIFLKGMFPHAYIGAFFL